VALLCFVNSSSSGLNWVTHTNRHMVHFGLTHESTLVSMRHGSLFVLHLIQPRDELATHAFFSAFVSSRTVTHAEFFAGRTHVHLVNSHRSDPWTLFACSLDPTHGSSSSSYLPIGTKPISSRLALETLTILLLQSPRASLCGDTRQCFLVIRHTNSLC